MNKIVGLLFVVILLLLLFAPSTCNGITYYTGFRGCNSASS